MYEDVRVEKRGACTWIVIARPAQMNAERPRTYAELTQAFQEIFLSESSPSRRSEDHREGVASHVEKRKPVFRER